MHMNVLKDVFGRTYLLVSSQGDLKNKKLKPMIFHEAMSAKRFLKGMEASHGYWRRLLLSLSVSNPNVKSENEFVDFVSTLLVRGRVKVYKSFVPSLEKTPRASRSIETGYGKQLVFLSAGESLLTKSKVAKSFVSGKETLEFLQSLNLTESNLTAITAAISNKKSVASSSQEKRKVIAEALLAEELVLQERVKRGPAPKLSEVQDSTQDIPGNRPIDAPPPVDEAPKQKDTAKQSRDAEQAEALIKAAEAGEAFCEDCQQVDEEQK
ncbi:hypothetical protein TDB9533_00514 [Thalassocella blandensis]|nr:hypothetical protein TDB9533_00514 [Thalassocella blandensis]